MTDIITLDELREYIRGMPEDEILTVYLEEAEDGREDRNDGDRTV